MMVVFVSQCEKKALARTRRILDAFADRIGDRTWQTVITQEGLLAVKKLLRQTASKNTAVSCHYIRTRSITERAWVVGRQSAFNNRGVVPVNYTSKELIMDKLPSDTTKLIANQKLQPLTQHLFAVGYVALQLLEKMGVQNEKLKQLTFIAGVLHDIGKIDPEFQSWLLKQSKKNTDKNIPEDGAHIDAPSKFSFEKYPRHNEFSWVLSEALLRETNDFSPEQKNQILYGVYWHHRKPYRKASEEDKFARSEGIFLLMEDSLKKKQDDFYEKAKNVLKNITQIAESFNTSTLLPIFSSKFELAKKEVPSFKNYNPALSKLEQYQKAVTENALNNILRTAVISADRLVSSLCAEDLEEYLVERSLSQLVEKVSHGNGELLKGIEECLDGFKKRFPVSEQNSAQNTTAHKLAGLQKYAVMNDAANIGVLQGPAGCGKTKIVLEWATLTEVQKIIWVCPRVQVCQGLLHDLTHPDYLPNSRIEIFTGEYKKILSGGMSFEHAPDTEPCDYFSGDIVITTIDQIMNSALTHNNISSFVELMHAHVVFDEFHELIPIPGFNLLFAELMESKKLLGAKANTLLVSATPNYFFLKDFLNIPDKDIVTIDSFNSARYQIDFDVYDETEVISPLITKPYGNNTFVISNTAHDAQLGYLLHHNNENSLLFHSKYTKSDKVKLFNEVVESFKREGNRKFDVLRSGPIVQASLNISCDRMITELTSPENCLQRLGRLDRFGMNKFVNRYTIMVPESFDKMGKQTSSFAKFLSEQNIIKGTRAWLNFLKDKVSNGNELSINELYQYYREYYSESASLQAAKEDFLRALGKSVVLINKNISDPVSVLPKSKKNSSLIKILANSLRGDNCFVQMAVCKVSEILHIDMIDEYAYDLDTDLDKPQPNLTASVAQIRGYDNEDHNLVQHMRKKHHNIRCDIGYKKARNEWELIKEARSPDKPIYLSYTPSDLAKIGGTKAAHPSAIYYVISSNQPVGAMSIDRLKQHFMQIELSK